MMKNDEKAKRQRSTIYMDDVLKDEIQEMADRNGWAFADMCFRLLKQVVKDRNRKSKNGKEDSTTHIA